MSEDKQSFGESARENAKIGDEQTGHGVEDILSREDRGGKIERTERSSGTGRTERIERTAPTADRESVPAANVPGNTSETGGTPSPSDTGPGLPRTTSPSPLKRPAGCAAPTGALLVTSIAVLGLVLKQRFR